MSQIQSIANDLLIGEYAIYLAGNDNAKLRAFKGGNLDNTLPQKLYAEQWIINNVYSLSPSYINTRLTSSYLYYLYGIYGQIARSRQQQQQQSPPTISNPANQNLNVGATATFTVSVVSFIPYTVQWYRNGVAIVGAISTTYNLPNVQLTDSGALFSATATNAAGSVSSNTATLTVTQAIVGQYYYGDTDYSAALLAGTDAIPYVGSFSITDGQPFTVPFPVAAANNKFIYVKYPAAQPTKTVWVNTSGNFGTIPDQAYQNNPDGSVVSFGGSKYIISRGQISQDSTQPTVTYS